MNWNTKEYLENCLESINKCGFDFNFEVIVVDNYSSDLSVEMVQNKFPDYTLIANKENLGFGKANNQAFLQSAGDVLLLLNPDTVLEKETVLETLRFLQLNPKTGALGCRLINLDGSTQVSCGKFPNLQVLLTQRISARFFRDKSDSLEIKQVDWVIGAYLLIPREVAIKTGLFDPRFFVFAEDMDLCKRIKDLNYKVIYFGPKSILHIGGVSTKKDSTKSVALHYLSSILYYKKHNGWLQTLIYRIIIGVFFTTQFLLRKINAKEFETLIHVVLKPDYQIKNQAGTSRFF